MWAIERDRAHKRREQGGSPEARAASKAHNDVQPDWEARCRKCGAALTGTMKQIKDHRCA